MDLDPEGEVGGGGDTGKKEGQDKDMGRRGEPHNPPSPFIALEPSLGPQQCQRKSHSQNIYWLLSCFSFATKRKGGVSVDYL